MLAKCPVWFDSRETCLGFVWPPEWLNCDIQPLYQHPAPTLVLRWQSRVDAVQLLLQRQHRGVSGVHSASHSDTDCTTLNTAPFTDDHLRTHCSALRGFFRTGLPSEVCGRSLTVSSTCKNKVGKSAPLLLKMWWIMLRTTDKTTKTRSYN